MPTGYEPVNVSPSTPGFVYSSSPTELPGPVRQWKAPGGTPASRNTSYSLRPQKNPWCEGLKTTVFPATSAPPAGPPDSAIGKLNGLMTAQTP